MLLLVVAPIINIYLVVTDMHPLHWTALVLFIIYAATYDLKQRTLSLCLVFAQIMCMLNTGLLLIPYTMSMAYYIFISIFNAHDDSKCNASSAIVPSSQTPFASTTTELCAQPASSATDAPFARPSADTTTEQDALLSNPGAPVVASSS